MPGITFIKYLELGYSGIIVTDHFFNGNCIMKADDIYRLEIGY